ncbi:MAG: type II toxin-antitoxin system VapC family toxin [Candidatus Nanohalobium sp.]
MEKVYVDTNIFLDALKDRTSRNGRDLGTPAMSVFSQAKHGRFKIIVSDWTLQELGKHIETEKVKELFSDIGEEQIIRCSYSEEQKKKAKDSSNHWEDYLHGLVADEEDADCIVTRNVDDFRILSGVKAKLPGQL